MTKNKKLAIYLATLVTAMVLLSFASVPLYNLFCSVTGLSGSNRVDSFTAKAGTKNYTVRFNADTMPNLPWDFKAEQSKIETLTGIRNLVFFSAENTSDKETKGTAIFNVLPAPAAQYFSKIECFCFSEQILKPGETMQFPVSFYIDSKIEQDPLLQDLSVITLSYSFFASKK